MFPAVRSHTKHDKYLDVHTYSQFGNNVFLASDVPSARITSSSILTFLPPLEDDRLLSQGMLELPKKAFSQYVELNCRHRKRYERLWSAWIDKHWLMPYFTHVYGLRLCLSSQIPLLWPIADLPILILIIVLLSHLSSAVSTSTTPPTIFLELVAIPSLRQRTIMTILLSMLQTTRVLFERCDGEAASLKISSINIFYTT